MPVHMLKSTAFTYSECIISLLKVTLNCQLQHFIISMSRDLRLNPHQKYLPFQNLWYSKSIRHTVSVILYGKGGGEKVLSFLKSVLDCHLYKPKSCQWLTVVHMWKFMDFSLTCSSEVQSVLQRYSLNYYYLFCMCEQRKQNRLWKNKQFTVKLNDLGSI